MRRPLHRLALLGLTLLAVHPASAAVAASVENRASGCATVLENLFEQNLRLSGEGVRGNIALAYEVASDVPVAARGSTTVIGKLDDLKNLAPGERTMLNRLSNLASPKANWAQNSSVLRQEMGRGLPIRDASVDSAGRLINNTSFLRAERSLLETHGLNYNQATRMWHPPVGP